MLLGRESELDRLRGLLAQGRGVLALRGPPGIGKTALLDGARAEAADGRVLEARGVESESTLPFAALRDLLEPVADRGVALPPPQWAALAGAIALGPPAPGDRLAVCVATLALLDAAAPLLVLVDDLQWLDPPSRECVLYVARRAPAGVVVVLTEREGGEEHDLPLAPVGPLDEAAATALLLESAPDLTTEVRSAVTEAAAGNPLALVELPDTLTADQRLGLAPLEQPLAPRNGLQRVFTERAAALPSRVGTALLVAAACQTTELVPILAACRELGVGAEDLQIAEAAGLVAIGTESLTFSHPLVRGGAYHGAPARDRRAAHRALADVVADDARGWHLAAAAVGPDEEAAKALERAAGAAAARRAYAVAADALERAARLSDPPAGAPGRLVGAAVSALSAGHPERASKLADEAAERAVDPATRAAAGRLRGMLALWGGRVADATALLEASAEDVAQIPGMAAVILGDAAFACSAAGDCRRALALAERAAGLLPDGADPMTRAPVLAILGGSLVLSGHARRARPILEEVDRLMPSVDPLSPAAQLILSSVNIRLPFEDYEGALADAMARAAGAREAGSLFALPSPLVNAGCARYLLGQWDGIERVFDDGIAAAQETGQWGPVASGAGFRARIHAAKGDDDACRADAATALGLAEAAGARRFATYGDYAIGLLELGCGHMEASIAALERCGAVSLEVGMEEPLFVPWAAELVEAYVRAGRDDDARRTLAVVERQAAGADTRAAAAIAARCRGLLAEDFDAEFAIALEHHDARPMPFERARTLLAWGMRLHRARRRVDARDRLHEAVALFEELGAAPWAEQARAELRAAGGRRRESAGDDDALTTQEQRVALAAARGATTREIAAELFLSPKTVEFHLGRVYRKLDVHSRAALSTALADRATGAPPSPSARL